MLVWHVRLMLIVQLSVVLQCSLGIREVSPTCSSTLHELKQDINTHCNGYSVPAAAISQFIH